MRARFGGCVLDTDRREIARDGSRLELPPKAFLLLEALLEAHPAAVDKETLYRRLWPDVVVETGNLHTLVAAIRAAIGDAEHQIIRTHHRFGYALAAEVTEEGGPPAVLVVGSRTVPLHRGDTVIGRALIGSVDVSRVHARITIDDDSISVADLGSKNGTWLGGKRIDSALLDDGDEFYLGNTLAVIRRISDAATMTAPSPVSGTRG